ncbi:hypothetical protein [Ralstonia solanacearum]|uniref:hypothetical protein n=1 Tax=Ralstonia solanacearum TaxID=305 RepID=UPI000F6151EA|nr:hypothetical protein [Ralstonia solanacearum]
MHIIVRFSRIVALLLFVLAIPAIIITIGSRYTGDRVYIMNSTSCRVVVTEEHDGYRANPGESTLIKSSFVNQTPTMMIRVGSTFWFGGLHFSQKKLRLRDHDDVLIPRTWRQLSFFGTKLTYEITADGELRLKGPRGESSAPQPSGLPLKAPAQALAEGCGNASPRQ